MNASIAIALLTKLKLIFETDASSEKQDQKFLAFQNGEFTVGKELFYFIEPSKYGISLTEANVKRNEFAGLFNFVAQQADMVTILPDMLPDIYSTVLKKAIAANSHRTPAQEEQYRNAIEYLNREETQAGTVITPLARYEQYQQLYKTCISEYKTRQLQAAMAEGAGAEAVKAQWNTDEPALKNELSKALLLWETKGKKQEVENWLGIFNQLAGAAPVSLLADLRSDYELFAKTSGADGLAAEFSYLPTLFNPSNFFEEQVAWPQLSLDKMEVAALYEKAPEALKRLFEKGDSEPEIRRISFEYAVVTIVRDWFPFKEFFQQRFWKLPAGEAVIADGNGGGLIPSFPEKLIFVRNLVISFETLVQPAAVKNLSSELFFRLEPQVKRQLKAKSAVLFEKRLSLRRSTLAAPVVATDVPVATRRFSSALFKTADFRKFSGSVVKPPPVPPTPPVSTAGSTEIKSPEMELLAFICRKMPLCPNPDPNLDWS
ncbi:hypothetical protein [Flavihumibacter sp. CACIAM 22H1]|uniref:hypothetical protein n=1 Tax=Flavihumibacter sp. CACIAM 22H1 TaxID=1812911 RepID=UPI0007A8AA4A|nr:hypothetical protein [Flavihumibacter sp. CACIAM 22H1]KYP14137.1 MAG: hypothetical protein A1D16_20000 [Flavihumibacter sp. CACIAM 22H1]